MAVIKMPTTQIKAPVQTPAPKPANDYQSQVNQFRQNIPQYENQLYQGAVNQARNNLAGQMADIRSNAASRGLLYGGLRQGAEDQAKAATAGELGAKRLAINQAVEGQANDFSANALNRLLEQYYANQEANQQQYGLGLQRQQLEHQQQAGLFSGLMGVAGLGLGAYGAFKPPTSDKNEKESIKSESGEIDELYKHIKPETYSYKDEENGEGKHLSPMAQDLEKSEIGKSMVVDTPEGKTVNYQKGFGAMMSMQKALDTRLKKLEAR